MKLIIRADDVGYTKVHNFGTWKVIEEGIATSADVMLDTPGTEDALERLRDYPWISIGWHPHFWGTPLLGRDRVPTLFDAVRDHFRRDLDAADISYDEAMAELGAELDRCIRIYGTAPAYTEFSFSGETPFGKAMADTCEKYGIANRFFSDDGTMLPEDIIKLMTQNTDDPEHTLIPARWADEKWLGRKIFAANIVSTAALEDSLTDAMNYDPVGHFLEKAPILLERPADQTFFTAWHPGYVDHYVMKEGDLSPFAKNFTLIRAIDAEALCDRRMKNWIMENHVELVSIADALFGTRHYQNHLRMTGSPLAI